MVEIIEIYSADREQLSYRCGDRFSNSLPLKQKESLTSLYGEHYYYHSVASQFGYTENDPLRIISLHNQIIWSE